MRFSLKNGSGRARTGLIETSHGKIMTPSFVPVGTQGSVKTLTGIDLNEIGSKVYFANTYHLMLRPGVEVIKQLGGIHKFAQWNYPIMTDSGGFQVFSLGAGMTHGVGKMVNIFSDEGAEKGLRQEPILLSINEDGVEFKSHLDGRGIKLTPELSITAQFDLGSDILMSFDECTSPLHDYNYTKKAMKRTHDWAKRSLTTHTKIKQKSKSMTGLYGVVQGGHWKDLRSESAKFMGTMPFDGMAIGGSLGRSKKDMLNILEWVIPLLPEDKPRHLFGIGEIEDIFEIVKRGIDTFDVILPTRLARMGLVFTNDKKLRGSSSRWKFRVDITNRQFRTDGRPIEPECKCFTCKNRFSRAYLSHLFRSRELLGYRLATIHNLWFYERLMDDVRDYLSRGKIEQLAKQWLS